MTDNLHIRQENKISISANNCLRSVEIADSAINNGFLLQFSGASLAIFLYLITHADSNNTIKTNPTIIASFLASSWQLSAIDEGLKLLDEKDIIDISSKREGDYSYTIKIKLENLKINKINQEENNTSTGKSISLQNNITNNKGANQHSNQYFDQRQIRTDILAIPDVSRSQLFQAILTFIPPNENISILENSINQWLEDFDTKMIKELIRRVNKWLEKYNNPAEKGFQYLNGIIDDWYKKEIGTYQDLQYYDQLYRETREIASLYGLNEWHNIKPTHMETFKKWLKEDFPLSVEIIKLAIQEATRRKKDGQPSLQYIEDNFISTWKKKKIRNKNQAIKLLNKSKFSNKESNKVNKPNDYNNILADKNWDKLSWEFED